MKLRRLLAPATVVAAVLACTPKGAPTPPAPSQPPPPAEVVPDQPDELQKRVANLEAKLEAARKKHHVPGMAVAVVKDGGVVFAKGFGFADLDEQKKVDARTLFAIGSSTKAFTATLVGMLVDDGKMSWDDPIAKHVPEFVLDVRSDDKAAKATIRDALCHRTGFTRMGLLWAGGEVPRKEFLAQASNAKPLADFRDKFLYNNVTYTAVGEATARVADTTWAELLQARILEPLGMKATIVGKDEVAKAKTMAKGYRWDDERKHHDALPFRPLDEIAPAGAINSHVLDMTRWLRFQLDRGQFERERLIRGETLAETWSPQITVGGGVGYGMGWFLEHWNGKRVAHHGGNIDGFSSMVALVPEESLGFVMLSNISYSPMQNAVREIVFDAMLGELEEATSDEDLSPYVGDFVANFGPFADSEFKVTVSASKLFVNVPGQMNYELKPPGEDGRRTFAQTDQIAVSFEKDDSGEVQVMRLHQGGLDFELLRKGYLPPASVPLDKLRRYEGYFENTALGRARVLIRNNRLAVDIPKQMVYELHKPDDEGMWRFRVKDDIAVSFAPKKGKPRTMTLHQGGKTFAFKRGKPGKALPTIDTLLRKRNATKVERVIGKVGTVHATGRIRSVQAGLTGTVEIYFSADGRASVTFDWGKYGMSRSVVLADRGWEQSSFGPDETLEGRLHAQGKLMHPWALFRDWRKTFENATVKGRAKIDGREAVLVEVSTADLPPHKVKVDARTGDVLEESLRILWRGPGAIPTTRKYADYRKMLGLRLPGKITMENEPQGALVFEIDKLEKYEGEDAVAFPPSPPEG